MINGILLSKAKNTSLHHVLHPNYIKSCSILIFIPSINDFNCDASLVVMEQAMTGRETPQARPRAILLCIRKRENDREKGEFFGTMDEMG